MQTASKSGHLTLASISKNLELAKPVQAWDLFINNIAKAFDDFKSQFQEFITKEMLSAKGERLELMWIASSELNSPVCNYRIIKMANGGYTLYNEFLKVYKSKQYFGEEQGLAQYFKKTEELVIYSNILERFQVLFNNTNAAKYPTADKIFEIFAQNLLEEFSNYSYISWERVVCKLKDEKKSEFPCLNDILQIVEKYETTLPVKQIAFLKKLKLII